MIRYVPRILRDDGMIPESEITQHNLPLIAYVRASDVEALEQELRKWQQPFDPVAFQATQEQASHGDSLAAQAVYIVALEHALKHLQQQLATCEERVYKEHEWILKEIYEWGMQTETTDLNLTTAEFGEVWRGAQKLLKAHASRQGEEDQT